MIKKTYYCDLCKKETPADSIMTQDDTGLSVYVHGKDICYDCYREIAIFIQSLEVNHD